MSASATKKVSKKARAASGTAGAKALKAVSIKEDTSVFLGRGAEGMKLAQGLGRVLRGRPKKGTKATGTSTRSVRLPDPEWDALDAVAKGRKMTPHAAMREAIMQWLARAGAKQGARLSPRAAAQRAGSG